MRQLTSLDAQFLAMESARMTGHVGGLAICDPSTAAGGTLNAPDLCRVIGERLHLLRRFRWRLVAVPSDLDHPYWVEDPDFDLDFHIRESAVPPPGTDRMKTLYLRNVPDDVSERLAALAARDGMSVSSFALRELTEAARRADNPALLGDLPDLDVPATGVIADLEAARSAR